MKAYVVKNGYVFSRGRERLQGGQEFTSTEDGIKSQSWKVEESKPKAGRPPAKKEVEKSEQNVSVEKEKKEKKVVTK